MAERRHRAAARLALGLADLAAAEDLLAREEEHVAAIDVKHAQLEGLVGKEPPDDAAGTSATPPRSRSSRRRSALEALGPIAKEPRARERLEVEVRDQESALERARDDEANARARVEANARRRRAGRRPRRAARRLARAAGRAPAPRSASTSGRSRRSSRAEQATMKTATRYLEAADGRATSRRSPVAAIAGSAVDDKTLDIAVYAPEKGDWVDGPLAQPGHARPRVPGRPARPRPAGHRRPAAAAGLRRPVRDPRRRAGGARARAAPQDRSPRTSRSST